MSLLTPFMTGLPKTYFYCKGTKEGMKIITSEEFWAGRRTYSLDTKPAAFPQTIHNTIHKENTNA